MMQRNRIGEAGEAVAKAHIEAAGWRIIEQNFHSRYGEIDLIATDDQNTLLFIEVRLRKNNRYGSALESVTPQKQQRFLKTVEHYLQLSPPPAHFALRIDVIGITGTPLSPTIEWIENAFGYS